MMCSSCHRDRHRLDENRHDHNAAIQPDQSPQSTTRMPRFRGNRRPGQRGKSFRRLPHDTERDRLDSPDWERYAVVKLAVGSIALAFFVLLAPVRVLGAAPTGSRSDPAVIPAGGVHVSGGCQRCNGTACRHQGCRHAGGDHADCRDGHCVPYCPVRPAQFGYYGTQWRRWPGAGVVPVSGFEDATPAAPPRLQVPGPDEESPQLIPADDQLDPTSAPEGANPDNAPPLDFPDPVLPPEPVRPEPAQPEPAQPEPAQPEPAQPEPAQPEPAQPEPAQPEPPAAAPAELPAAEQPARAVPIPNPFDDAAARGWRKFLTPASAEMPVEETSPAPARAGGIRATVAPVPFDHEEVRAAESVARGLKISVATPK
jgi:hypothetical protein